MPPHAPHDPDVASVERWFIGRGIPHFIDGYAAKTDIWNRAIPLLVAGYVLGGLNALDLARSWRWNLVAGVVIVAFLVAAWAVANRISGRPLFERPHTVGPVELTAYVIGPALPSAVLGQWSDAARGLAEGLATLAVIYFGTSYGVLPMTTWAVRRAMSQLRSMANLVIRVLPLLLLFMTFLFINAEVWQLAGNLDGAPYWLTLGIFFALGVVFVLSRVPGLITSLSQFDDWAEVRELIAGTPAARLDTPADGDPPESATRGRAGFNIGLVSVFSQALQITLVAVALFAFFVLFGLLAVPLETTAAWSAVEPGDVHVLVRLAGRPLVITEQLMRVAGFLAAFSGMYLTVVLATDATYREEVAEDVGPEVRQAFAVRAAYLHNVARVANHDR